MRAIIKLRDPTCAYHHSLSRREFVHYSWLTDIQDDPKDPSEDRNENLDGEEDPSVRARKQKEVAAARMLKEEA